MLVNSLESLGFLSVFKAYQQAASDVQCRDRRRLDPLMRIVPGTDCAALRHTTKSPRPAPGAYAQTAGQLTG